MQNHIVGEIGTWVDNQKDFWFVFWISWNLL